MNRKKHAANFSKTAAVTAAAALSAVMLSAPAAMPVFGASDTASVVDPSRTGTLVIHKIVENNGTLLNADGLPVTSEAVAVDNIGFDRVKIASIKQLSGVVVNRNGTPVGEEKGAVVVGTWYVPEGNLLEELFAQAGTVPEAVYLKTAAGIQTVYTTEGLETAMQAVITTLGEERINQWVNAQNKTNADKNRLSSMTYQAAGYTDTSGSLRFEGLDLGLYMVAETDISYHDGKAGAWNDGTSGLINQDPMNTYDASGYHIQPIDGWGQETVHDYAAGDYYKEAVNPEGPVIESCAAPFLVSLPTTNTTDSAGKHAAGDQGGAAGSVWRYTVDVYPKNQTTAIYKRIVDPDEADGKEHLRTSEDYQIGDKIEQIIWADAPVLQKNYLADASDEGFGEGVSGDLKDRAQKNTSVNEHLGYAIADTMTKGLTFDKVTEVAILSKSSLTKEGTIPLTAEVFDGTREILTFPADYRIVDLNREKVDLTDSEGTVKTVVERITDDNYHGFAVVLTAQGLARLNARDSDSVVAVRFDAILNKDATIGQVEQNMNYPQLDWVNTNTSFRTVRGNEVYDYTYELQLEKSGVVNGNHVKFVVSRDDANDYRQAKEKDLTDFVSQTVTADADDSMRFVKEADGIYHVWGFLEKESAGAEIDEKDAAETVTVNGKTWYCVTPAKDGKLVLKGLDSNDYIFKEIQTEKENNLLAETFLVSLRAEDNTAADEDGSLRDGRLVSATVKTSSGEPSDITIGAAGVTKGQDLSDSVKTNAGIAALEIRNHDAIDLRTGGSGTTLLYLAGAALAAGIGAGIFVTRKKNKETA